MMSLFSTVEWSEKKFEGLEVGVKVLKQANEIFRPVNEGNKSSRFILTTRKFNCLRSRKRKRKTQVRSFQITNKHERNLFWGHIRGKF